MLTTSSILNVLYFNSYYTFVGISNYCIRVQNFPKNNLITSYSQMT